MPLLQGVELVARQPQIALANRDDVVEGRSIPDVDAQLEEGCRPVLRLYLLQVLPYVPVRVAAAGQHPPATWNEREGEEDD